MPSRRPHLSSSASSSFKIANKHKRTSHNISLRRTISKAKLEARHDRRRTELKNPALKRERLLANIPQTLDSKRVAVDVPYVPSEEMMERARRRMEDALNKDSEEKDEDEEDEDSDEEMEDQNLKGKKDDVSINIEGGEYSSELASEDQNDKDGEDGDGDEEDDLGSLYDSDSDSETTATKKSKKPAPSKPLQSSTLPEEALTTLLSLIPHPTTPPKLLLTSTRRARQHQLYQTLSLIFPNTTYVPRGTKFTIPQIASFATNRQYTHLLVALEDSKTLHGLIIILLPAGPTFHFSLTNFADGKAIQGRGVNTNHVPELILNNFTTTIGRLTASLFQSLYPPQPQFMGRQVVTLHNQRDYIFFRFHRYIFREIAEKNKGISRGDRTTGATAVGVGGQRAGEDLGIKVGLQELGPQFTLKLRRVERGICEGIEWEWKGKMEKDRKMFHL
ncbi:hypothetical protein TWF569_007907 [Orbilia oligospora]|uniref:Brix domain-containing protein n=1 Tax=Orbilia oligospora TaxID=2813651 RepID=A0A7C8NHJ4_ORBOL|nr:hypothetical protein TWF102_000391 [Orbilia oligospora]KAF3113852.1 hypothetical protein TWF706_009218 [Orbilia oligospora]KAF3115900.1 hypothetical protein TWF103_010135 [Orbilia oligospora]KAF3149598.1 hypothetical protein TWF594_010704 [Orbilia oligospora]KAF3155861.1 hypothetical protein TWF569_007907 [Orbilia oligospora]